MTLHDVDRPLLTELPQDADECPSCEYFNGVAAQYPADDNPTIARHLVRWRKQHAEDGECSNPQAGPDE